MTHAHAARSASPFSFALLVFLAAALLAGAASAPARAADAGDGDATATTATTADAASPYSERVTVTSTRLSDREEFARDVPASTVVLSRREIEASGLRTVQELLARVAGATFLDEIGNGVQMTFDLRGFTGGGVTVLLDGARLNDPRNNSVALETIQLDAVERIEIVRGAAAATVGGGSAAGVVNIVTRQGNGPVGATLSAGAGSFSGRRYGVSFSGSAPAGGYPSQTQGSSKAPAARPATPGVVSDDDDSSLSTAARAVSRPGFDWFVAATHEDNDGFRDNADAKLDRLGASAGYTFASRARLSFSLHAAHDTIGAPGALTIDEWKDDPDQAPFNRLDRSEISYRQGSLNWRSSAMGLFTIAANLSYLSRTSEALTTGRSAPLFGGFHLDAKVRTLSGAAQATAVLPTASGRMEHSFTIGAEGAGGRSDADGCGTLTADLASCDPVSFLNSSNATRRRDVAVFLQDSVRLGPTVTAMAGGRWDDTRFDYRESLPDPSNDQHRSFSQASWKAGLAWNPADAAGLYASYGESFGPPTVEDLFAFPGFGSNPDLDPVDAKNYEVGARGTLTGPHETQRGFVPVLDWAVSVFRTNLSNEIVFDPTPAPGNPFGSNVNAGRSRHQGFEVTGGWRILRWLNWSFAYAHTRATFENGANEGNDVPLVPRNRYSETNEILLPHGVNIRIDLLHVGKQVLSNDDVNGQQRLDGYFVVDGRVAWRPFERLTPGSWSGAGRPAVRSFELFVEGKNLGDREYATRGIYAFDFSTSANSVFVTPAPGRRWFAGGSVTF